MQWGCQKRNLPTFVGVATCWNESVLVIFHYPDKLNQQKRGEGNHGTPREFTTITVTDGIAMGHEGMKSSLVSREVIADSIEVSMKSLLRRISRNCWMINLYQV